MILAQFSSNVANTISPKNIRKPEVKWNRNKALLKIGYYFTEMKWLRWWHNQKLIKISPVCSNNILSLFKIKFKAAYMISLPVKVMTSLCFIQNNWSYIFWKISKNWDSFNIWHLLYIYNSLDTLTKIWESFGPMNTEAGEKLSPNISF